MSIGERYTLHIGPRKLGDLLRVHSHRGWFWLEVVELNWVQKTLDAVVVSRA